jgi:hypothetical protein
MFRVGGNATLLYHPHGASEQTEFKPDALKGTVSRDFLLSVFLMNHLPALGCFLLYLPSEWQA